MKDALLLEHSVGAMMGMLATNAQPSLFRRLVMLLSASPRYIDEPSCMGVSQRAQAEQVVQAVPGEDIAWCNQLVPLAVGRGTTPGTAERCGHFAHLDARHDVALVIKAFPASWAEFQGRKRESPGALVKLRGFVDKPGNDLLSHARARAVPSALEGLTSEFGMGSGMAPPTSSPEKTVMKSRRERSVFGRRDRVRVGLECTGCTSQMLSPA